MIDKKDFKILLLFPPVWLPEIPYLSLPALTAYLKKAGYSPRQKDLNIEFWQHFLQENKLQEIYRWSKEVYVHMKKDRAYLKEKGVDFLIELRMMLWENDNLQRISRVLDLKNSPFPSVDQFTGKIRRGGVKKRSFRKLSGLFWQDSIPVVQAGSIPTEQWESHIKYHDYFFSGISLSNHSLSSQGILRIIKDEKRNPFIPYFRDNVIPWMRQESRQLVGISVIAVNQVIPAFTLAKLIKESLPGVHIVLGGPWCTHLSDVLPQKPLLFEWIDSVIIYEGEQALLDLAGKLRLKEELSTVPNLIYKKQGAIQVGNRIIHNLDLNMLPAPDFSGLALGEYDLAGNLPLQASRGCPWHRCIFCSYPVIEPNYRPRSAELVTWDMKQLSEDYKVNEFCFTDAAVETIHFKNISELIIRKKLKCNWRGFARFDAKLTEDIIKEWAISGCRELFWGLESGCPRILKLIKKGHTRSLSARILRQSAEVGIHNRVGIMYGFPTETIKETRITKRFIEDNVRYIHSLAYNFLTLERNTILVRHYGNLIGFEEGIDNDLDIGYNYQLAFDTQTLKKLEEELWELSITIEKYHERKTT